MMPALRPCPHPGCPVLTREGPCPAHRRQREQARGSFRQRGYSSAWDRAAAYFRMRYPLCGMRPGGRKPVMSECYDDGRATPAYQTDHVKPHKGNMELFWDEHDNWQSLCRACGARKSQAGL